MSDGDVRWCVVLLYLRTAACVLTHQHRWPCGVSSIRWEFVFQVSSLLWLYYVVSSASKSPLITVFGRFTACWSCGYWESIVRWYVNVDVYCVMLVSPCSYFNYFFLLLYRVMLCGYTLAFRGCTWVVLFFICIVLNVWDDVYFSKFRVLRKCCMNVKSIQEVFSWFFLFPRPSVFSWRVFLY